MVINPISIKIVILFLNIVPAMNSQKPTFNVFFILFLNGCKVNLKPLIINIKTENYMPKSKLKLIFKDRLSSNFGKPFGISIKQV